MSYNSYIFNFLLLLILSIYIHSEIELSYCQNNTRKIIFENGEIKEYPCIFCPIGEYTTYDEKNKEGPLICLNCTEGSSNYGQDIILNTFSTKILSKNNFSTSVECPENSICPKWKINPMSLRVDYLNDIIYSKSKLTINQYYMNNGSLIIKYINYNGGIDKYFNIYINDKLMLKDDSDHSIIKIKEFNITKGENKITFEYAINSFISSKGIEYDDDSYLEIFEIQMINAETSSINCNKYDTIEELKYNLHDNCQYYINKCSDDTYCTSRFYSENISEYCNSSGNTQTISYNKIPDGICEELISPLEKEIECQHCTYGQYLIKDGDKTKCEYCSFNNTFNDKKINDEEYCNESCDIKYNEKQLNKIYYITSFEDPSEFIIEEIKVVLVIGYIEVNYEKFNERENVNIFLEINDLNIYQEKTIELINPNENDNSDGYNFNIPIGKGLYYIKIKGKNLKINKISIKGTDEGGNYKCVDKLNVEGEVACSNESEHYSPIQQKCIECKKGSFIDKNKECIFIEQYIHNKFILDNNNFLMSQLLNSQIKINLSGYEYFFNLNPSFPLIYYSDDKKDITIIGKELDNVHIVKGINNRGYILSYLSIDNNIKYKTYIFFKCNLTNMEDEERIILISKTIVNDTTQFYFTVLTNDSCPYCLNSEVDYIDLGYQCRNKEKLINITLKNASLCVIKPYNNLNESKLFNDTDLLLNINSSEQENRFLFEIYGINESIPINYEKDEDEINTLYQKNISCQYERKSIGDMGTGIFILVIIGIALLVILIGVIIWKIIDIHKNKDKDRERIASLTEYTSELKTTVLEKENENEN